MKIWSILLLSSLLAGCGVFQKEPKILVDKVYFPPNIRLQTAPTPLRLLDISVEVVNEDNLEKFIERNRKRYGTIVFIALDVSDYENLSLNRVEYERYIKQQKAIIMYYEDRIKKLNDEQIETEGSTED